MKCLRYILATLVSLAFLESCEAISNFIHDDERVAKIGRQRLYVSDVAAYLPAGISPEDSAKFTEQYANSWALEQLYQIKAEQELSKAELDVSKELEDYRKSLLKYRYEQKYINERLDTLVGRNEIEAYYREHKDMFVLEAPIVKARFLDIMKESPNLDILKEKMSADGYQQSDLDSIAYSSALKYEDKSDEWVDMNVFARNFGVDSKTLLSGLKNSFIQIESEKGDLRIGFICEMEDAGTIAPVEYCEERIKDIVISNRKRALMQELEQSLIDDARKSEELVLY